MEAEKLNKIVFDAGRMKKVNVEASNARTYFRKSFNSSDQPKTYMT